MAFQQGLSGLNSAAKGLDVVSNNIANASTVGFKGANAQFADVFATAMLGGTGQNQIGLGGNVATVAQSFAQGNLTVSNNPLDLAINGNGFFRLQESLTDDTTYYTRNGQFHMDKSGYIINGAGAVLTGYISSDGIAIDSANLQPLQVNTAGIAPMQTGATWSSDATTSGLQMVLNLDSRSTKGVDGASPNTGWTSLTPWNFANLSTNMYNYSTSASIYDQGGIAHTLSMYFVRQNNATTANTWDVHFVLDGTYEVPYDDFTSGTANTGLAFNPNGTIATTATATGRLQLDLANAVDAAGTTWDLAAAAPGVSAKDWFATTGAPVTIDLSQTTQFGSAFDTNSITQDGYPSGLLNGVTVSEDGKVLGRYTNGQSKLMGQLALVDFRNPNGLQSVGSNMWVESSASGQPAVGLPKAGTRGSIQSGAVEDSNIDLTGELVNLITMQRNYQANAQSIKTQDQMMQTLVNLR